MLQLGNIGKISMSFPTICRRKTISALSAETSAPISATWQVGRHHPVIPVRSHCRLATYGNSAITVDDGSFGTYSRNDAQKRTQTPLKLAISIDIDFVTKLHISGGYDSAPNFRRSSESVPCGFSPLQSLGVGPS